MRIIKHSIIGGGLSALVKDRLKQNSIVFCDNQKIIIKSKRFYENIGIGGNSNIWGGYINYKKLTSLCKNKKFNSFIKSQKIFKFKSLFIKKIFHNTYYISNYKNNNIFRVQKKDFYNPVITKKIEKISFKNKKISLYTGNKKILTESVSLCVGNLSLLKILNNSNIINSNDIISFDDGNCSYVLNTFLNFKNNYYIPLTINEIIEKLIKGKKDRYYNKINKTFFVQKFSNQYKKYNFKLNELMQYKSHYIRYFLSHHIANLRVNNIPINLFIKKFSKKINIYSSGVIEKYRPGPVSQDIIYNAVVK